MPCSLKVGFAAIALLIAQQALAQNVSVQNTSTQELTDKTSPVSSDTTTKANPSPKRQRTKKPIDAKESAAKTPKLTPDQELGYQTLESAESQARALEAPMRSYALLQIASAYTTGKPEKARTLLQDSFAASLAIQDDDETKRSLQTDVFRALLPLSQSDVEERLTQAEPDARKGAAQNIIGNLVSKKQFDRAIELVQQVTSWDEFPYGSAYRLFEALPPEMNGEKQALFASAVASYRAHDHKKVAFGNTDFPNLVNRFGPGMPPKLALEAIDEILSKSKNDAQDGGDFSISVGGSEGSATFKSRYEYNLFILLPLLRQLDETRAQQLLEEDAPLKITATQYPKGMESISPTPVSAPDAKEAKPAQGASFRITRGDGGGDRMSSEAAMRDEMRRRTDTILKMAETDPTQAVAQAAALPLSPGPFGPSPRGDALQSIARESAKKNPAGARLALAELRKITKDLEPRQAAQYLYSAAKLYLDMDDQDRAEDTVGEGLGIAAKMLDSDLNPDDPNKALKAWWPSADAYRRCVEIETKISHPAAAKMIQEIKDADIRTMESITFARTLLGAPTSLYRVVVKTKQSNMSFMMMDR